MKAPHKISANKFQLDALDGLRGLAVLFVFLSHTSNTGVYLIPGLNFSGIGTYGVFLFFILSSFLLTYPFLVKRGDVLTKQYFSNYFLRRFLRIYPLYMFYLIMALATTLIFSTVLNTSKPTGIPLPLTFDEFLLQLSLQQGKSITWSILVEFRYYFLLPIVAIVYSILLKNKLLPSALFTILLIVTAQYLWPYDENTNKASLGKYLPVFFTGSFLSVLHFNWEKIKQKSRKAEILFEIIGVISFIFIILLTPSILPLLTQKEVPISLLHSQFILFSILWGTILFASINGAGILKKIFENKFLRYIGFISFSFYLWHLVGIRIIKQIDDILPPFLLGYAMLIITILMSHISYKKIEVPASRIKFNPRKESNKN